MSSSADRYLDRDMGDVVSRVAGLKAHHQKTWRDKSDWFWFRGLIEEIIELGLALIGLHKDPANLELLQISAIAANWLELREERNTFTRRNDDRT